jgi:hypothetical protein
MSAFLLFDAYDPASLITGGTSCARGRLCIADTIRTSDTAKIVAGEQHAGAQV